MLWSISLQDRLRVAGVYVQVDPKLSAERWEQMKGTTKRICPSFNFECRLELLMYGTTK